MCIRDSGSTSKTPLRLNPTMKNGRFAMLIISDYIQQMPPCATIDDIDDRNAALLLDAADELEDLCLNGHIQCLINIVLF